jgi:hypothetical protein
MYYFTIGATFKNESHILKEWIEHYKLHGVDHIYLINDNSNDSFLEILEPYINSEYVTLYDNKLHSNELGRQSQGYNYYFQKHLNDTVWFSILDLDEFLYSPQEMNIKTVLANYEKEDQLQVNWVHFGSSGHVSQPENVVGNFLYRGEYNSNTNGPNGRYNSYKSIVNTQKGKPITLSIHSHTVGGGDGGGVSYSKNISFHENPPKLLINHYAIQSLEFWKNVKMTRGDINRYYDSQQWKRDIQLFDDCNRNTTIMDMRLFEQNTYKR